MNHSEETDLFAMLKRETAAVHGKVMEESWAQRDLSTECTLPEYRDLLKKYYGLYLPLEILPLSLRMSEFHRSRPKHPLLQQNLSFLNSPDCFSPVICSKLPGTVDVPSALGICYVL